MLNELVRNWWVVLLRGLIAILFGVMALLWPGVTLLTLVVLFGAFALLDGVTSVVMAVIGREGSRPWWSMVLTGLAGLAAGIAALTWPGLTLLALLMIIGVWAIVRGVFEIVAAVRLRQEIEHEWLLGLTGALSIIFGVILVTQPAAGGLALIWMIAIYALLAGILLTVLALRLYGLKKRSIGPRPSGGAMPRPA